MMLAASALLGAASIGLGRAATASSAWPSVSVTQIQAEIERHIAESSARTGGYYRLTTNEKQFEFKLVRVHTEYLSRLGHGRQFACVDLVDRAGDVYDVDFFLEGGAGAMRVTETSLHKLNGIPFYTWKQEADRSWTRVPVEGSPPSLMGVVTGTDTFEFRYRITIPALPQLARLWIPLPASDAFQTVELLSLASPVEPLRVTDRVHGNTAWLFELGPQVSGRSIDIRYRVRRREKPAYAASPEGLERWLQSETLVPDTPEFRAIAEEVVRGKMGDLVRARALYDHVMDRMRYMKHGPGWGKGDAVYACRLRTGNCSDFHAYFVGLARAAGIPARFAVGAAIPSERDEGGIDGYHCWAEFYAEGKWWPVDVSEADKYSSLATYYFGHHPANRIEFSRGRDLVFDPGPQSGPINFLAFPVLEVGRCPVNVRPELSFQRKDAL